MYVDALSFLEDEREAWRPFEALADLSDTDLERPVDALNGWSGRDLMAHIAAWLEVSLDAAKELAVNERSAAFARAYEEWHRDGDAMNDRLLDDWRPLSTADVRERFRAVAGELRGYLTVVPEARWVKHADHQQKFFEQTIDHYEDHARDLQAVLEAAGRG